MSHRKKTLSRAARCCAVLVLVLAALLLIFAAGRYGWKLAGFRACQGAGIERVTVTEGQVEIKGCDPSSFPSGFIGYVSEERDGQLFVGVRFSAVFGFFETGQFQIQIPTQGPITQVYLKTADNETLIWPDPLS